jgi:hypothetical protein
MAHYRKDISPPPKYEIVTLLTIVLLGLIIRLYGISLPLVDSHQVRQVQTAMMARNLFEDHMNIFLTRLDMLGNVPGYIILEFPLMHGITALLYYLFGVQEIIGRLVNVAFSVGSMFLMYGLARFFLSRKGAFAALILYALSPMNIFFSRAFMPESSMMFFSVGALYFVLKWLDKDRLALYLTSIIFAAFAYLAKPTAILITAPIFAAWFLKYRLSLFRRMDFWLYLLLTTAPFILWGAYANYFNSKITFCTFSYSDTWLQVIRARGTLIHWFAAKFYVFLGGSIILALLTPLGFLGMLYGIFCIKSREHRVFMYSYLAAVIFYFYALASCTSGHYYYHLYLLPVGAIFFGFAIEKIVSKKEFIKMIFRKKLFAFLGMALTVMVLLGYGLGYVKFFQYMYKDRMPYLLEVSAIIRQKFPGHRFLIDGGSGFLTGMISYYSHSKSLPFNLSATSKLEIENLRNKGATALVVMESLYGNNIPPLKANKELWKYLNDECKPIVVNEHYLIFDLRNAKSL